MIEKILGIDLGASHSVACVHIGGKPIMIPSAEGNDVGKPFPSYVAFTEDGTLLVGQPAEDQAVENPDNTFSEIKRYMGTDYKVNIQGTEYTPQKISAMILQKIKRDAESFLGEPITKAVITVPANFDDNQRTATKDAGTLAGFEEVFLINEPTAAAIAYGLHKEEYINILVFDLGSGTLDITIMEFDRSIFNILSTSGNTSLGGTDMDNVIIKYLADEFEKKHGIDLTQDEESRRVLREGAEKAKIELSNLPETTVKLPFIAMSNDGSPLHLDEKLSQSQLEELVHPIVEQCGESIDQAVCDADLTIDEIDKVILVGETTRMPIIQDYVENYLGKVVEKGIDPVECIAIGASVQGAMFAGENITEVDVTPSSIGMVGVGGITNVLIKKNTPIPTEHKETFTTVADNQTEICIELVMGENRLAHLNRNLGSFVLDGIQPAPRGVPLFEVTFEIDEHGILHVNSLDKATGNTHSITVENINSI